MAEAAGGSSASSNRPTEQPAVYTTIVGGRPPGCGTAVGAIPRGLEVLVKKAAIDPEFRRLLLERRDLAAADIQLALTAAEAAMLRAVPAAQLEAIIDRTQVPEPSRRAFLGRVASVMLAALGAVAGEVCAGGETLDGSGGSEPGPPTNGIRPDVPPNLPPGGVRPDVPPRPPPPAPSDLPLKPVDRFSDAPADPDAKLACALATLPAKGAQTAKIYFRVTVTNPGKEPVQPLGLFNRPGMSTGTGIGVEFCPAASPAKAKETPQETAKETGNEKASSEAGKPPAGKSEAEPAPAPPGPLIVPRRPPFALRPDDIFSVLSSDEIAPGKTVTVPVMLRLPDQAGKFQVRAYLRSWAYADPAAKDSPDETTVRQQFIRRIVSPIRTIEVTATADETDEKPLPGGTDEAPKATPPRPVIMRGVRPDKPRPSGGDSAP